MIIDFSFSNILVSHKLRGYVEIYYTDIENERIHFSNYPDNTNNNLI